MFTQVPNVGDGEIIWLCICGLIIICDSTISIFKNGKITFINEILRIRTVFRKDALKRLRFLAFWLPIFGEAEEGWNQSGLINLQWLREIM